MALIGIDLGTTYCAVARLDERGRPITICNSMGEALTPSAIFFAPDGSIVVGSAAIIASQTHPDRVATFIKRFMGRPQFGHRVAGRTFRPETLSAILLRKLAQDAAAVVGPEFECVITVPAYFDETRRKATLNAGRIAGLDVIDILDEPSAAGLAYTLDQNTTPSQQQPQTVLVYDLGGGTFDVTIVRLSKKRFNVLAIEGDYGLGGKDWDDCLVQWIADRIVKQHGLDPRHDHHTLARLRVEAERAKRRLSDVESTTVAISVNSHDYSVPITRDEFEKVSKFLLFRTWSTTQNVMKQAGLTKDSIDRVLMVGGSTHMPMVGRMLAELTGKIPDRAYAVSEVVAHGAALHAGIFHQRLTQFSTNPSASLEMLDGVIEVNVNAHSLGVEVRTDTEKLNNKLIPKNTQLPAAVSRVYFTTKPGQQKVRVRILQGEAHQAEACIPVGECWIDGLPADLPKGSPIQVRCEVTASGMIEVMAMDMTTSLMARAQLHHPEGLTDEEIAEQSAWVKSLSIV